ncbi:NAD(P)H-dependent oxidoreductase [Sediminibacterium roseum]|uniref:NAD(P)H-dependent oxidoreductase n=1 Tax=Sediminibacterium roseum TaxID=1978412 RepID=A0ABW9ZTM3_9BACT|nr:NADPH-dependent FMN reductase [Sediminibacterium roseum]NCI50476.1 NAD(P)H-dependent oxidoreductase [Sediminibacterium roseum]
MPEKKRILAVPGSTRSRSVNLHILQAIASLYEGKLAVEIYDGLDQLPHFNPDLDKDPLPPAVASLRKKMELADGIVICTPEYVFSLPGSLKNAIEWMVSTTILTGKPAALITASSSGQKAHESLDLVMRTVGVKLGEKGSLLIQGPKTKITEEGVITDETTLASLKELVDDFLTLLN